MKQLLSFAVILLVSISLQAQQGPKFKFETESIDYGKIAHKSNGKRIFKFTNVGDAPLSITKAYSSCGCTVPKFSKDPIMPGKTGTIEVVYDTKRVGGFSKMITVVSNASATPKRLKIRGIVQKPVSVVKETNMMNEKTL